MPQPNRLNLPTVTPKAQAENKVLWNEARAVDAADFFTIGYTGRKLDEMLASLEVAGVRCLIDVRQYPVSMYRPEVSKVNLCRTVESRGMEYLHLPQLGVPRDIRAKSIDAGSRDVIWTWYDEHVVRPYIGRNLDRFLNGSDHPVAFMCVERDPSECHRHRLFLALEAQGLRGFEL